MKFCAAALPLHGHVQQSQLCTLFLPSPLSPQFSGTKMRYERNRLLYFWTKLLYFGKRDPANYGKPKQRKTTCPSPVPTDAWNTYLLSHSNAKPPPKPPDTLNRNSRHIDARASAVPLGRGRISQGMNRSADAFDCLSLAVMTCLRAWYLNF